MHLFFYSISLHFVIAVILAVKLKPNFAPNHPYHTPSEIHTSPCNVPEEFRSCWVKTMKKDSWSGIKAVSSPGGKFVLLKPDPRGSFHHARRVCEACDLEIAEVWDEDDLEQFLNIMKDDSNSYWIGAFQNKKQDKKFRWTYQDGKTFVGFKRGIKPENNKEHSDAERSCLTLAKKGDYSAWTVVPCSSPSPSVICQYKRKYDCYEDGGKNSLTLMKTGHYLSSKGLPWTLASQTCQSHPDLSLIYFHPSTISKLSSLLAEFLPIHNHNPSTSEIWTGARFENGKLFWHLNSGQKFQIPDWKDYPWGKEPKPGNSDEPCVYIKLDQDQEVKMFTGDCDLDKFYVCKTPEDNGPIIRYCENDILIERKSSECKWNWVFDKKPGCICFKGVHGLTSHTTCNTRLLLSEQTRCIKLPSLRQSILHWKPIPEVDPSSPDPFLLLQNRNRRGHKFIQWISLKPGSKRQIFGDANIYFKGLSVSASSQIGTKYCFERILEGDEDGIYNEVRIRNESFWVVFNDVGESCEGEKWKQGGIKKHTFSKGKDECDLKCSPKTEDASSALPTKPTKSAPQPTNLNSEMLKHMVNSIFAKGDNATEKAVELPDPRLLLLDKLFNITRNICSCMVPTTFLDNALHLFKVAHSIGNYEYRNEFKEDQLDKIKDMLDYCFDKSVDKAVVCERNECSGRASKMTGVNKTTPVDDTGYITNSHHHLIEVVWNVIEIWNVGCVREFKQSYLLYHATEQAMEKLFIGEIRKLWHNPTIPPNYYQHLLGPNEEIHMSNLKNCVNAVYESNPKVLKLVRPKSSSASYLGKQIRNRKRNEEFLHDQLSKTIFCSKDQFCLD